MRFRPKAKGSWHLLTVALVLAGTLLATPLRAAPGTGTAAGTQAEVVTRAQVLAEAAAVFASQGVEAAAEGGGEAQVTATGAGPESPASGGGALRAEGGLAATTGQGAPGQGAFGAVTWMWQAVRGWLTSLWQRVETVLAPGSGGAEGSTRRAGQVPGAAAGAGGGHVAGRAAGQAAATAGNASGNGGGQAAEAGGGSPEPVDLPPELGGKANLRLAGTLLESPGLEALLASLEGSAGAGAGAEGEAGAGGSGRAAGRAGGKVQLRLRLDDGRVVTLPVDPRRLALQGGNGLFLGIDLADLLGQRVEVVVQGGSVAEIRPGS
ncbi:DUF4148 domain-containing protein [Thermaerobacter sp. PB12/4term]|uniref:DUF4148 domain-containing protein n=1 Tax=Thermaerobacter sp. PB12/4term TaxID=2293838 RepID=UPI000E32B854|nr:DUF4148 domain-containing protein [Thermaerobacter sp. PB12/4term]QIA26772.1 DUF4148 domain-containing protein [Thermaerobacter sp. PB12/4term]